MSLSFFACVLTEMRLNVWDVCQKSMREIRNRFFFNTYYTYSYVNECWIKEEYFDRQYLQRVFKTNIDHSNLNIWSKENTHVRQKIYIQKKTTYKSKIKKSSKVGSFDGRFHKQQIYSGWMMMFSRFEV